VGAALCGLRAALPERYVDLNLLFVSFLSFVRKKDSILTGKQGFLAVQIESPSISVTLASSQEGHN
jgi:hypothetical protein